MKMKLKKRSARSRLRGQRTCGYGSRKKHRGKGSKGGKGMAGTGKRAGQKITLLVKEGLKLGKVGFKSIKQKKGKPEVINLKDLAYKISETKKEIKEENLDFSNYKILAIDENQIDDVKQILQKVAGKKVICKAITANAKRILEECGIEVIPKEKTKATTE
jgi:large subunit ribosomal protein L15